MEVLMFNKYKFKKKKKLRTSYLIIFLVIVSLLFAKVYHFFHFKNVFSTGLTNKSIFYITCYYIKTAPQSVTFNLKVKVSL